MPRNSGFGLHSRIATGAILLASMSGCASNVRVAGFGDLPTVDQVRGYRIAANADGKQDPQPALLTSALSGALARKGLAVDPNSEKSIEVSFAIRSPRIALQNGLATARARPFASDSSTYCRSSPRIGSPTKSWRRGRRARCAAAGPRRKRSRDWPTRQ